MNTLVLFTGKNAEHHAKSENASSMTRVLTELGMTVDTFFSELKNVKEFINDIAGYVQDYQYILVVGGMGEDNKISTKDIFMGGLSLEGVVHEPSREKMKQMLEVQNRKMEKKDEEYIKVPKGSVVFEHAESVIPGFSISSGDQILLMLPDNGEIYAELFAKQVVPYLIKALKLPCKSTSYHVVALKEDQARYLMGDIVESDYPVIALYCRLGIAEIVQIIASHPEKGHNREWIEKTDIILKNRMLNLLSKYSAMNLPFKLIEILNETGYNLAIGETISDGFFASSLLEVPGARQVILAHKNTLITNVKQSEMAVPSEITALYSDASAEMATAVAAGVRQQYKSDIGVSICGGMAPDGKGGFNSSGFIGISAGKKIEVFRIDIIGLSITQKQCISILTILTLKTLLEVISGLPRSVTDFETLNIFDAEEIIRIAERIRQKDEIRDLRIKNLTREFQDFNPSQMDKIIFESATASLDFEAELGGSDILPHFTSSFAFQPDFPTEIISSGENYLQQEQALKHVTPEQKPAEPLVGSEIPSKEGPPESENNIPANLSSETVPGLMFPKETDEMPPKPEVKPSFMMENQEDTPQGFIGKNDFIEAVNPSRFSNDENIAKNIGEIPIEELSFSISEEKPKKKEKKKKKEKPERDKPNQTEEEEDEMKQKKGSSGVLKVILAIVIAITLVLAGLVIYRFIFGKLPSNMDELLSSYQEGTVSSKVGANFPASYDERFADMYNINPEVQGVISIPKTDLIIPVVKTGENHSYTQTDFFGQTSAIGVPFMDYRSNIDPTKGNLLIYGLQQEESDPFFAVAEYQDINYAGEHNLIVFENVEGELSKYEVFSCFVTTLNADVDDMFDYSSYVKSVDKDSFTEMIKENIERSIYAFPVEVTYGDEIIMLSCNINTFEKANFVVMARKLPEGETGVEPIKNLKTNSAAIYPGEWYQAKGLVKPVPAPDVFIETMPEIINETPEVVKEIVKETPPAASSTPPPASSVAPPASSVAPPASSVAPPVAPPVSSVVEISTVTPPPVTEESVAPPISGNSGTISINDGSSNITGDALDIVSRVVAAEISPSYPVEAIKAQAVATYTYIVYSNNKGQTPYVPMRTPNSKIANACAEVIGQLVTYNGAAAFTTYHAMSAGRTNSSEEVWGGYIPYLVSVDSSGDLSVPSYSVTRTYSESEIRSICESKMNITMNGDPSTWFETLTYSSGGYNEKMVVGGNTKSGSGRTITGRMIREAVLTNLRSAAFDVSYSGGTFTFVTRGYGHGVGLSQWGAYALAEQGYSYRDILAHYYPGTSLV